jgi:hypothetical protein
VLLNRKGETNLHHKRHYLLLKPQNVFLVEQCFMANKYLRISSLGDNYVSSPYLAQIVVDGPNKHKTLDLEMCGSL